MMTPRPARSASPAIAASWSVAPTLASTMSTTISAASMARRASSTLTFSSCPPDARSVDNAELAPVPGQCRVHGIAGRTRDLADDHALLAEQPIHQRGLAGIRPAHDRHLHLVGRLLLRRSRRAAKPLYEHI